MGRKLDLIGKKYSRLTVLKEELKRASNGGYRYLCLCECGRETVVRSDSLINGHVKSCGCFNLQHISIRATKHGQNKNNNVTSEYNSWHGMIQRCTNKNSSSYPEYGGRGISIYAPWLIFENFFADMGKKPSDNHSLDRYPNNETGNYEPSNCRWGTTEQQSRNKRTNRYIEYDGENLVITDWAKKLKTTLSSISIMMKRGKSFGQVYDFYTKKNTT